MSKSTTPAQSQSAKTQYQGSNAMLNKFFNNPPLTLSLKKCPADLVSDFLTAAATKYIGTNLYQFSNSIVNNKMEKMRPDVLAKQLYSHYNRVLFTVPIKDRPAKVTRGDFDAELSLLLPDLFKEALLNASDAVKFDPNLNTQPLIDFLTLLLSRSPTKAEICFLQHCLWQVKRKALDKSVRNHLWLNLLGPQDNGKTTALRHLFTPFAAFQRDSSVADAIDERSYPSLEKALIVFCDELSKAEKASAGSVKRLVTAEYAETRTMRTHDTSNYLNRASFFSASNDPIGTLMADYTGMRRFVELGVLHKVDLDTIKKIDPFQVWKCVDEEKNDGYVNEEEIKMELKALQAGLVEESPIETWFNEYSDPNGVFVFKSTQELITSLNVFLQNHGFPTSNAIVLGRHLRKMKVEQKRTSGSNGFMIKMFSQGQLF